MKIYASLMNLLLLSAGLMYAAAEPIPMTNSQSELGDLGTIKDAIVEIARVQPDNDLLRFVFTTKKIYSIVKPALLERPHLYWAARSILSRCLRGVHWGCVESISFSPDSKTLASSSGGYDPSFKLWDVQSGGCQKTVPTVNEGICQVAFSATNKSLASGAYEQVVKLWDLEKGAEIRSFQLYRVKKVAFANDGSFVAFVDQDGIVRVADIAGQTKPKKVSKILGPCVTKSVVAFAPDNKLSAAGLVIDEANGAHPSERLGFAQLKDDNEEHYRPSMGGHEICSMLFSPDCKRLACGSSNGIITLWDVETGNVIGKLHSLVATPVCSLAFFSAGRLLAAGFADCTIIIRDTRTNKLIKQLSVPFAAYALAVSPDSRKLAAGLSHGFVMVWETCRFTWAIDSNK